MEDLIKKLQTNRLLTEKEDAAASLTKSLDINTLVEWGTNGHFPLFYSQWLVEFCELEITKKSKKQIRTEKKRFQELVKMINKHRNIERKKTLIMSLSDEDRKLFINNFLTMVEAKILDRKPEIH